MRLEGGDKVYARRRCAIEAWFVRIVLEVENTTAFILCCLYYSHEMEIESYDTERR